MSLSRDAMMDLMAYADGELADDAAATARIEALVQTSEEARRVVEAMRSIGDVVRELPEAQRAGEGLDLTDAVMAKVDGARMAPVLTLPQRRAIGRAHYATAIAAVVALAAGVAVYLRSNAPPERVAVGEAHDQAPAAQPAPGAKAPAEPPAAVAAAEPKGDKDDGVDLEEVESADHHVSVFYVPKSATGAASAHVGASVVVWIDDHGGH